MRMVVVLPAPFGPRKPRISPFSTRKRDPVDGRGPAVPLGEALDLDHAVSSPRSSRSLDARDPPSAAGTAGVRGMRALQGARRTRGGARSADASAVGTAIIATRFFGCQSRARDEGLSGDERPPRGPAGARREGARGARPRRRSSRCLTVDLPRRPRRAGREPPPLGPPARDLRDRRAPRRREPAHAARPGRRGPRRGCAGSSPTGSSSRRPGSQEDGTLVPLLARSGLVGMLVLGPGPGRRRPARRRRGAARLARRRARRARAREPPLPARADRLGAPGRARHDGRHAGPRLPRADDRDPRLRGDAARGPAAPAEEVRRGRG